MFIFLVFEKFGHLIPNSFLYLYSLAHFINIGINIVYSGSRISTLDNFLSYGVFVWTLKYKYEYFKVIYDSLVWINAKIFILKTI